MQINNTLVQFSRSFFLNLYIAFSEGVWILYFSLAPIRHDLKQGLLMKWGLGIIIRYDITD